jgi:hypothetical protein
MQIGDLVPVTASASIHFPVLFYAGPCTFLGHLTVAGSFTSRIRIRSTVPAPHLALLRLLSQRLVDMKIVGRWAWGYVTLPFTFVRWFGPCPRSCLPLALAPADSHFSYLLAPIVLYCARLCKILYANHAQCQFIASIPSCSLCSAAESSDSCPRMLSCVALCPLHPVISYSLYPVISCLLH